MNGDDSRRVRWRRTDPSVVRPYVITGGMTRAPTGDLPIESVVSTAPDAAVSVLGFERREIAELCQHPTSIAEVASSLELPLGVARFLVTDLTNQGYLSAQGTVANGDTALLLELIEGIRSL